MLLAEKTVKNYISWLRHKLSACQGDPKRAVRATELRRKDS